MSATIHFDGPTDRADIAAVYALDALDPTEVAAVEAALATDTALADEVARFQAVAAALAELSVTQAPPDLRDRVLGAALRARADAVSAAPGRDAIVTPTAMLARSAAGFIAAAERTTDVDWETPTGLGLSVGDVVAHLGAAFDHVSAVIAPADRSSDPSEGATQRAGAAAATHADYTRPAVAAARGTARRTVVGQTRASLQHLVDWATAATAEDLARPVGYEGAEVPASLTVVARAFEAWAHGEHVRRACGQGPLELSGGELALLCDVAVGVVPVTYARSGHQSAGRYLRLVLTGPGGGTWNVPDGDSTWNVPDGDSTWNVPEGHSTWNVPEGHSLETAGGGIARPAASVVMESVDLCRVTGGLADVADVFTSVSGDEAFARELLGSLAVLAE